MPCGSRTHLARLEAWGLCRSAKGTCMVCGRRGSRTPKANRRPLSRRLPSPVGLSFRKAAVAGIEPASGRLTAAYPYQHGSHRIVSINQSIRIQIGALMLSKHVSVPGFPMSCVSKAPSGSRTRTSAMARRQAAATSWARLWYFGLSKNQSTGWESNPRLDVTKAVSSPLDDQCNQWGRRDLNPYLPD